MTGHAELAARLTQERQHIAETMRQRAAQLRALGVPVADVCDRMHTFGFFAGLGEAQVSAALAPALAVSPDVLRTAPRDGTFRAAAGLAGRLLRRDMDPYVVAGVAAAWGLRCRPPMVPREVMKAVAWVMRREAERMGVAK